MNQFKQFTEIVNQEVKGEARYAIAQRMFEMIPDTTEFEDAPATSVFNSEPGAPGLQRRRSGRHAGLLAGDEPVKRPLARARAEK